MPATYRVYILQNCEGGFYVGLSDDVAHRVEQHNTGHSRWTKGRGPWAVVWQSEELSLTDARKLENRLKRQGEAKVSIQSLVCVEAAHNPAAAGPRVQIPPPQANFRNERFCCSARCFQLQIFVRKEALAPIDRAGKYALRNRYMMKRAT
jgi:putative endonuclease